MGGAQGRIRTTDTRIFRPEVSVGMRPSWSSDCPSCQLPDRDRAAIIVHRRPGHLQAAITSYQSRDSDGSTWRASQSTASIRNRRAFLHTQDPRPSFGRDGHFFQPTINPAQN